MDYRPQTFMRTAKSRIVLVGWVFLSLSIPPATAQGKVQLSIDASKAGAKIGKASPETKYLPINEAIKSACAIRSGDGTICHPDIKNFG
jgi:hypothetical protein